MAQTRSVGAPNSTGPSRSGKPNRNRGMKGTASGRGGKPSSGNRSIKPSAPQISQAALATYKHVQQQLEAQKKAIKEAEDAAIRARNKELLDAESNESGEEDEAPARKRKKTSANLALSDDEEELASGLASIRAAALGTQAEDDGPAEEEDAASRSAGEDEDLHVDLDGINVDEVDVEMDLGSGAGVGDFSNEVIVEATPEDTSTSVPRRSHSRSTTPKTPRSKAPSASHSSTSNASKVVEKDFTPRTLKLALSSKSHVRTKTIFDEPFPRNNKISRINFAWTTIKESALASDEIEVLHAYKRATKDIGIKTKLMKFTLYGRTGLISSIISKAREKVRAYYGFSGDADLVKKDVEWLLIKSHFAYGGINLRERTVDQMKPFGAQIIIDIIEAQWFPSTSRSKLDLETTNRIYQKRDLPLNVMLLVVTAIEHALKEWSSTGHKACQITFSEDTARLSFERHLRHWKYFESQMKAWPGWWRKTVLEQILVNHSNFDLNEEDNDFAGLDFSGLDRLAGYEEDIVANLEDGTEAETGAGIEANTGAAAGVSGQVEGSVTGSGVESDD